MIRFGELRYGILSYSCMILAAVFLMLSIGDAIFLVLEIFFIPQSVIIIVLSLLGLASFISSGLFLFLCSSHYWQLYSKHLKEDRSSHGKPRLMTQKEEDAYYLREGIQRNFDAGTDLGEVGVKYYAACDFLQSFDIINEDAMSQNDNGGKL